MKQGYGKSYLKKKEFGNISEESTQHLDLLGFLQNPLKGGVVWGAKEIGQKLII